MSDDAALWREIQSLSPNCVAEALDFVAYLKQKSREEADLPGKLDEEAAYTAMAADTGREQEAREWCGAYFGPVRNQ